MGVIHTIAGGVIGQTYRPDLLDTRTYQTGVTPTPTPGNITHVGTVTTGATTASLPAGTTTGDIVIVVASGDSDQPSLPTGYTNGSLNTATGVDARWSYKVLTSADTTISNLRATGSSVQVSTIISVFRGVDTTNPFDVTMPTATTGTSGMPDPPSITTVTDKAMVLAMGFLDDDNVGSITTAPSGYTLAAAYTYTASTSISTTMLAYKIQTTAGVADPGAFTASGASDDKVGMTIALRPAMVTVDVPIYGNARSSGMWNMNAVLDSKYRIPRYLPEFTATSNTGEITYPVGLQPDDLVFVHTVADLTTSLAKKPLGFRSIFGLSSGLVQSNLYAKNHDDQSLSTLVTANNGTNTHSTIFVIRGASLFLYYNYVATNDPPATSLVSSLGNGLIIAIVAGLGTSPSAAPSGYTLVSNASGGTTGSGVAIGSAPEAIAYDPGTFTGDSFSPVLAHTVTVPPIVAGLNFY